MDSGGSRGFRDREAPCHTLRISDIPGTGRSGSPSRRWRQSSQQRVCAGQGDRNSDLVPGRSSEGLQRAGARAGPWGEEDRKLAVGAEAVSKMRRKLVQWLQGWGECAGGGPLLGKVRLPPPWEWSPGLRVCLPRLPLTGVASRTSSPRPPQSTQKSAEPIAGPGKGLLIH